MWDRMYLLLRYEIYTLETWCNNHRNKRKKVEQSKLYKSIKLENISIEFSPWEPNGREYFFQEFKVKI